MDEAAGSESDLVTRAVPPAGYIPAKMSKLTLKLEGLHLAPMDFNGLSDPYYKIFLVLGGARGEQIYRSETKMKTLNPEWNQHDL